MTQPITPLEGINVGELRRCGVALSPKEVVALVHALCDQKVCVATPDELWITDDGQVRVRNPGGAPALPDLVTMGVLIDNLLPPLSEERRYTPAASLQMLPARLRGSAEPAIVSTRELLYVLEPYETDTPVRVLQQLIARARAAAPVHPAAHAATTERVDGTSPASFVNRRDGTTDAVRAEQIARIAVAPERLAPPLGDAHASGIAAVAAAYDTVAPTPVPQPLVGGAVTPANRSVRKSITRAPDDPAALLIVEFDGQDHALDQYSSEQLSGATVDATATSDRFAPNPVVADATHRGVGSTKHSARHAAPGSETRHEFRRRRRARRQHAGGERRPGRTLRGRGEASRPGPSAGGRRRARRRRTRPIRRR